MLKTKHAGCHIKKGLSLPVFLNYCSCQDNASFLVLIVLCFGVDFCAVSERIMCVFIF